MTEDNKSESQYTEVTTRVEYEALREHVAKLAFVVEELTEFLKLETKEKGAFTQHYQYMIISMNILASVVESLIDKTAEKEGLDTTALRIELMERAVKRIKEGHDKWAGPMKKDMQTSDEFTAEAIQMRLSALKKTFTKKANAKETEKCDYNPSPGSIGGDEPDDEIEEVDKP